MGRAHVVVDGSNIATEGRTTPSLAQLDEAVRAFTEQYGYEQVTVIVDATFGRRIDESELATFEEAVLAGEIITPPAGTIGRGDAFILQVARMADADVLSNDSFQELHAEHPWLFESGRLWGGKPVPTVGWVFVARAPVRGATSRRVVKAAKRASKAADTATVKAKQAVAAAKVAADAAAAAVVADAAQDQAGDERAAEEQAGGGGGRRRRRRGGGGTGSRARQPVNEQLPYAAFVVEHPIGSTVTGTVERFSSHGAYVRLGAAAGYVPLRSLGDPPPRSAREVLQIGEEREFVVERFDPSTRGIDVVPADVAALTTSTPAARGEAAEAATAPAAVPSEPDAEEAPVSPAAKKTAAKKATAKKAGAKKAAAKKTAAKKATAKKATARKAVAKKSTAKKSTARKAVAKKSTAKKSTAKKATAKKSTAKKSTAKKSTAKKATAKKSAAKKSPAKKATAKRATARKRG